MISAEEVIVANFPKTISFLSRDEAGDLWVTSESPAVAETEDGISYLSYPIVENMDDMQSLSVFNHLFAELKKLGVVELNNNGE